MLVITSMLQNSHVNCSDIVYDRGVNGVRVASQCKCMRMHSSLDTLSHCEHDMTPLQIAAGTLTSQIAS